MVAIHERDNASSSHYTRHALVRTLRGGTAAMRKAGKTYLPAEPAEIPFTLKLDDGTTVSVDPYKNRLERSVLFNAVRRAIQSYRGKVFSRPVAVTCPDSIQDLVHDFDGNGNSLAQIAQQALDDLLWEGCGGLVVDAPVDGGDPYAYWVSPSSILGATWDGGVLTSLRLIEKVEVPEDGEDAWGTKTVDRVRVFRLVDGAVEWAVYQNDEEGGTSYENKTGWQEHGLDYIPFIPIRASGLVTGSIFDDSPNQDLADLNLRHWQETSDQNNIVHTIRIPILMLSGIDGGMESVKTGISYALTGDQGSDAKYVEHTGNAVGAGRQSIQDLEQQMQAMGVELLISRPVAETATGRAIDSAATTSALTTIALALQGGLRRALMVMADYKNLLNPEIDVSVNTDFGIKLDSAKLSTLNAARDRGDISQEQYLAELKEEGVLSTDFDYKQSASANDLNRTLNNLLSESTSETEH